MSELTTATTERLRNTVAMGNLSRELTGPVQLELARAFERLPGEHGMPGGSRYELKYDGNLHELVKSALPVAAGADPGPADGRGSEE